MIRVLLVDDEKLLLESLEIILTMNGMEVVGTAGDGAEALAVLETTECDIALVDLNMKGMGGIELIGAMKKQYPHIKILVLTTFYDDENITNAITGGADGYLLKDSGKDAIIGAVSQIMEGVNVMDSKVMLRLTALLAGNHSEPEAQNVAGSAGNHSESEAQNVADASGKSFEPEAQNVTDAAGITDRERDICALMVEGLSNRQIADRLYISEGTVKNYISNIYDKTGIHDRVKLILELQK